LQACRWRVAHAEQVEMLRLRVLRLLVAVCAAIRNALRHAYVLHALAPASGLTAEIERLASHARQLAAAAPLDDPTLAPQAPDAPHSKEERKTTQNTVADQIRRQVSVIATEIVTPFQDIEDQDPEVGSTIINPLVEAARREVERYGGIVLSSTDTSIIGMFGALIAREDTHSKHAALRSR
jgi:class 3 adenylate cyclase